MSEFEDADFCVEPWTLPPKRKRNKDSRKDKKDQKRRNNSPIKTQENKQKKNSKFKEAMMERKEKKKKDKKKEKRKMKKKKKNKLALELAGGFSLTQSSSAQARLFDKLRAINSDENEKLILDNLTQDSVKEPKRKRIVAFGSLPTYIRIKRPKFTSSSSKETEDVREGDSFSQVSLTGQTPNQAHDGFQSTGEDINSQDLFITQKTFRTSPSETSCSEASDGVITESPHVFKQSVKIQHTAVEENKQSRDKSHTESCQKWRTSDEQDPKTEAEKGIPEPHQTQTEQIKESVCAGAKVVNPYLDEPFVISPTPNAVWSKRSSCLPHHKLSLMSLCTANRSTQTENFFTTELSSYLNFCQNSRGAVDFEELQPLDLSLPQRVRKDLCLSVINSKHHPNEFQMNDRGGEGVFASPQVKDVDLKRHGETTPSPPSEADTKSADMTTSSEDDHPFRSGRRDTIQVGGVQLRLNKPFFFKTKGEGQSPRPESPLMKLSQGRDVKSKKRR